MKYGSEHRHVDSKLSRPMRGAWIEICVMVFFSLATSTSRPMRGAWIEISCAYLLLYMPAQSRPMRGAWIEILSTFLISLFNVVAPHAGRVD